MSKEKALDLFHNPPASEPELFNKAFGIYSQAPNCSPAIVRKLNTGGYTKYNLDTLLYEIQKAYQITDLEKIKPSDKPVAEIEVVAETVTTEQTARQGDTAGAGGTEPEQVTQTTEQPKIADEYPFLDDPGCPDELKILLHDKLAACRRYKEAHEQLAKHNSGEAKVTEEEALQLAKTATENFAESEAMKKELDYYKEKNTLLAEHPRLKRIAMEREVSAMTNEEAHTYITSSKSTISRTKSALKKAASETVKAELQAKLDERLEKVEYAKKKLGIATK
ncbi:hypothetical protein ACLI09_17825 [Flavobacterium sp. RHBU_24]|uniref:hypothetical protein n=1 Tax=Flavobacterium sp. RHBU_24 TaxID=3391185 RepID=UPI00398513CB